MTDRYLEWVNTSLGRVVSRRLGLPQPVLLPRNHQACAEHDAYEHRGRHYVIVSLPNGRLQSALEQALQQGLLYSPAPLHGLAIDATGLLAVNDLVRLQQQLPALAARLRAGGKVLLIAQLPTLAATSQEVALIGALKGFIRSWAKELGKRGVTANMLLLQEQVDLAPALAFFLTDRSAYVSGQVVEWQAPAGDAEVTLAGKVAVVTGAARGIGAAVVRRLALERMHVVCVDVPNAHDALRALALEVGGTALPLDITSETAPAILLDVVRPLGGVATLVHNAGITRDRSLYRMRTQEWQSVMDVNLQAVLQIDQALDAAQAWQPNAREICLASINGIAGSAGQTNYAASKAALIGYVQARALQKPVALGSVSAVAPGFIETLMTAKMPLLLRQLGRRANSLSQGGQPEDVAEAIAFLARSHGANGQTLRVCGQSWVGA